MLSHLPGHQPSSDVHRRRSPFVLQIVGYKNSGKTTLLTKLTKHLKQNGYTVGTIKHDAHDFAMDTPGTDTWKHQEAGANITAISSAYRSALISQGAAELSELLAYMLHIDVVLVEGFKQEAYPKIILIRSPEDAALLALSNPLLAVRWPGALLVDTEPRTGIRFFDIEQDEAIAKEILTLIQTSI
ncbi:molybdopterin-guanine dinucleotide biosynthesis protein B [Paenibacillus sp. R14(2021)]|uniref:molybdopterin-guanine dinucleotide biosynthesis protein B n=1 Tax=Paenibacillus sp. R14(2021) TaxID=2859228 RepID=UPI001C6160A3|nr:molybdopterin-guanine dinucleotide biosynthesis protein B [Paenibacillus sp. R14(2021)]